MLVANSFDLWQKDTFFSAAEEVQQSADIMESAYRTWEREEREGLRSEYLDELCRELQTALGTAKWQLEEFERAVRLSYRNRVDDITMVRHRQFVDCIGNKILRVEAALSDSFGEQGKQPLRWVKLDEEECNDLAAFLSGTPGTSQTMKDECTKLGASANSSLHENHCIKEVGSHTIKAACSGNRPYQTKDYKDVFVSKKDAKCIIDLEAKEIHGTRDDIKCQADRTSGTRRNWSSPDIGACKIVIPDEDDRENALMPNIEDTPKDKGSKHVFWRQRRGDRPQAKGGILSYPQLRGINWISQVGFMMLLKIMGRVGGCPRQLQTPVHVQFNSVWFKLALMLTIFLIVPFVLYST